MDNVKPFHLHRSQRDPFPPTCFIRCGFCYCQLSSDCMNPPWQAKDVIFSVMRVPALPIGKRWAWKEVGWMRAQDAQACCARLRSRVTIRTPDKWSLCQRQLQIVITVCWIFSLSLPISSASHAYRPLQMQHSSCFFCCHIMSVKVCILQSKGRIPSPPPLKRSSHPAHQ